MPDFIELAIRTTHKICDTLKIRFGRITTRNGRGFGCVILATHEQWMLFVSVMEQNDLQVQLNTWEETTNSGNNRLLVKEYRYECFIKVN